jgi:hypothetical protein
MNVSLTIAHLPSSKAPAAALLLVLAAAAALLNTAMLAGLDSCSPLSSTAWACTATGA